MITIENQQIWLNNVLSYRTRVEADKLAQLIDHIRLSMEPLALKIIGDIFFSVIETVTDINGTILGVEFIIPVDKTVPSNCHYVFKTKFRLDNAILTKYCGKLSDIDYVKKTLNEYAVNNGFTILTNIYYAVKQLDGEKAVLNAYMGVSGNSL